MGQVQRDSIINTIITYAGIGLGYLNKGLLFPLLLLPEQVGLANVILLIVAFFVQLTNVGTGMILLRFLPYMKGREAGYSGILHFTATILLGGISIITLLLLIFHNQILGYFIEKSALLTDYAIWVLPLGISAAFFSLFEHYLRALSRNIFAVLVQDFVLRLVVCVTLILYYFQFFDFQTFIIVFFLLHLIPGVVLAIYLLFIRHLYLSRSYLKIRSKFRKYMFTYGIIVYLNGFGRNIILMADILMLSALTGLKEVGIFTTMVFLSNALFVPYVSLIRISVPHVSTYWKKKDLHGLSRLYKQVSAIGFFVTFLLFSLVWFNIELLLSFLPSDYASGKYVFLLLMIARLFDALGGVNGDILLTSKKFKTEIWLTLPMIFVVFFLNLFLIPTYGSIGAALVTCLVYFIYNLLRIAFNFFYFKLFPFDLQFMKMSILAYVMFAIGTIISAYTDGWQQVLCVSVVPFILFAFPVYKWNLIPYLSELIDKILVKIRLKHAD
jgi:O-antigen/teichoic acid export membrane protein